MSRKRRKFLDDSGEDPTTGIINLTDCMLVLAVGFLVFAIVALNSNPQVFSQTSQPGQSSVSVSTGQTVNNTPTNASGAGESYQPMGTVYKDPNTGKLYLVNS